MLEKYKMNLMPAFFSNSFQNMECSIEDITNYQSVAEQVKIQLLNDKNRFVPMEERRDTSVLPVDVIRNLWDGKTSESKLQLIRLSGS